MEASFAELDTLVALITSAVKDVKAEYKRLNQRFPSLDDPEPHPLDSQHTPPKLKKAIQTIQGACAQLSTVVTTPQHALAVRTLEHITSACLRVAFESCLADKLKAHPNGLHISKLASQTGLHAGKLGRILRLLATKHCFREVSPDVYANNRLSAMLKPDHPVGAYIGVASEEGYRSAICLYESLVDPVAGHSLEPDQTAFAMYYKQPVWAFWGDHVDKGERFRFGISGFSSITDVYSAALGLPWHEAPPGTMVCDVGGGVGHMSMLIARSNPNITVIVQDLEYTVNQAIGYLNGRAPELLESGQIDFLPLDFLKESPVPDCDYYYLKHILHNWGDAAAHIILVNIKKAMKPSSRLIIQDYIIQPVAPGSAGDSYDLIPKAPAPLLSNYGDGRVLPYFVDLIMMEMVNSAERTLPEFRKLIEDAGFEFVKVLDCGELHALVFRIASG